MPVSAAHIRAVIDGYLHDRPDQASCLAPVLSLLGRGVDLTDRRQWAGHLTASAIVVNPQGRILLVQHVKYDRFLQPGGHLEVSDTTLAGAAVRELGEETGVRDVQPLTTGPLHISVHPIPPWPQSGELAGDFAHGRLDC
jgi:8-oxo-dGTP pyrophosphatase MutT (NUDIX family)